MKGNVIITLLIGTALLVFALYGNIHEFGPWVKFVGMFGFLTICLGVKAHAEGFRHINSYPIERRQRRIKVPKHKERRKFSDACGITFNSYSPTRGRKHV